MGREVCSCHVRTGKSSSGASWCWQPFLLENPRYYRGTQCCGLGGCAGGKEPELRPEGMACRVAEEGYETVYTYCASCAGNLTRNGGQGVSHLLTEILDYHEQPDVAKSMINRMMTRFW
ncbi:MAG: heterodisulfide reductase-related iron-sulfur binding cluster [Enterocloster sp.]|uniref:heterodisulfide reductase-related iron-sulfur binding cluster n=1 Tax=Enterocloster sp. TaxID=2719315 RepID=UPI00399B9F0B